MSDSSEKRWRLYDSHAHLVSDDPERYPRNPFHLKPSADGLPAIRPPFGPGTVGIPGGMHGPNPVNEKPTAEQMRAWMAEENVVGIAAVQKGMIYGTDNSYIVDAANLFPDRMRAVIIIDPQAPETPGMIRDLAGRGAVSIRFFPVNVEDKVAWLSSPAALAVWELADELGLVVDLEAPPYDATRMIPVVEAMADRFPKMPIVLDHLFMPVVTDPDFGIDSQFDGFAARKNIYVKWTSLIMDIIREQGVSPEAVLRRAVDFFGADKVMWGSDIGTSSGTYKEMVERAIASAALLDDEERRKVLHDTGRRVFAGWDGTSD
ncbi:MAG TPA: amidohydrolase family protein [Sphingomonadaceae bacterium]|jgi:predicted TIM-barrel fold metal-dependent hydrolase|nr:amidohydrolase family protein [Sphingomonadaceae bacterium]